MRISGRIANGMALGGLLVAGACTEPTVAPAGEDAAFAAVPAPAPALDAAFAQARMAEINSDLSNRGAGLAIAKLELSLAPSANTASPTFIFANDRTLRLTSRWVPDDLRRNAAGETITYAHFDPFMVANGAGAATAAVDASFDTWDGQVCTDLSLVKRTLPPGILPSALITLPGFVNDPLAADISTVGYLPGFLFDALLGPGASSSVLGVTATFVFIDVATGIPTDINGDHRDDTALKEVWYNNDFTWTTTGTGGIDVETVALHENGHGLELGHFGRIAANLRTGKLTVSPRAVMNAAILGVLRTPLGTDIAGYCGNFSSWPN